MGWFKKIVNVAVGGLIGGVGGAIVAGAASLLSSKKGSPSSTAGGAVTVQDTTIYIPQTQIEFTTSMLKPNTRLYAFFDGRDVTSHVSPNPLITNSYGEANGIFTIPNNSSMKFAAGQKEFKLTDSPNNSSDSETTSATATYIYTGTTENPDNPNIDASSVWEDFNMEPMIQSFYCNENGGMYISKVGLYFYAKDMNNSILFQIREVADDKVTSTYIGGSNVVINPATINLSADPLNETPTWIEFPNPIYLQEGKEYAIYMVTNSTNYILHMVDYGKQTADVTASKDISVRSYIKYVGVNNWVRDNSRGLKFKIQKCKFDTTQTYTLALSEDLSSTASRLLADNSISITNGSNVVTVYDPEHSFNVGGRITLSGLDPSGTTGGISNQYINGLHKITAVTWNSYSFNNYIENNIETVYNAFSTPISPLYFGTGITTDYDLQYDRLILNNNAITLSGTHLKYNIRGVNGQSVDGGEIPYTFDGSNHYIEPKVEYRPEQVKKIASYRNSQDLLGGAKSLRINASFKTDNENISPIIDKYNTNAIAVEFLINNQNNNETANNNEDGCSRMIFKTVNLYEQATGIMVSFFGSVQANASVSAYYKALPVASNDSIDSLEWVSMPMENDPIKSTSEDDFQQYTYKTDGISPFKAFKIKLVMNSTDSTKVPLIGKFAAIAFSE